MAHGGSASNVTATPARARRRWPVIRRLATRLAAAAGLILLSASPASAHADLVETSPASGSVVATAPAQIELRFDEAVNISLGRVAVLGPDGRAAQQGAAVGVGDRRVTVALRKNLARGTYLVSYRAVASDGHPLSGGFSFSVGARSATDAVVPGRGATTVAAAVDPLVRILLSLGKYAGYLGVVLLAGALVMSLAFWPPRLSLAGPRRWALRGWVLLLGGTVAGAAAQIPYATGGSFTDVTWGQLGAGISTRVELAQLARLVIVVAAGPLIRRAVAGRPLGRIGPILGAALAVGLFLTWPLAGHTATGPWSLVAAPIDAIHVGAVSVWVGGLVVLSRTLLPSADPRELAAILPVWSRWALWAVVAVTVSGLVQTTLQTRSLSSVVGTSYGQLVLAKIVGLAVILGVAVSARRAIRPHYLHGLRRAVTTEIVLACVVIALATALVQTRPGYAVGANPEPATRNAAAQRPVGDPFYSIDRTPALTLQIDMTPAQVGDNTMLLTLLDPGGQPLKASAWTVKASLPASDLGDVQVPVTSLADGVAFANPRLSVPGDWVFRVVVRTGGTGETVITRTVRIY